MTAGTIFKPLPLPEKDCTYQGTCDDGRIICDEVGDDVSPECCHYCRYLAKTYNKKPFEVAELISKMVWSFYEDKKTSKEK